MPHPPMVSIIGKKHSGKTTVTVRLAATLARRGHRVMTIKHGAHTFNIDPATTDTYRHYHEGEAAKVAMVAPDKFALVERWSSELTPEEVAERYMADADVIICEGFKRSALPKVEVYRSAAHTTPLYESGSDTARHYVAMVTDVATFAAPFPVLLLSARDWPDELATLVERTVMDPRA